MSLLTLLLQLSVFITLSIPIDVLLQTLPGVGYECTYLSPDWIIYLLLTIFVAVLGLCTWLLAIYINIIHKNSPVWPYAFATAAASLVIRIVVPPLQYNATGETIQKKSPRTQITANAIFF